jgi:acetylornithine deacetylase/succinyl-diaminopimelate desuccinylase-like protein
MEGLAAEASAQDNFVDLTVASSEVVRLLQDLLRFDTTNPPGNERACAEFLAALFEKEGIPAKLVHTDKDRANVVARLKGDGSRPPLLLSAHLDVVPAMDGWDHPPFAGEIHDGCVWGRGAVDMKHMAAMSAVALLELKRKGVKLARDVIFAGVADEEAGGKFGAGWLVEKDPGLIRAEYCLTEVGGFAVPVGKKFIVPVQTAQKGYVWFKMRARGEAGHGSKPKENTAVERLAAAVVKLSRKPLEYRLTKTASLFMDALAKTTGGAKGAAIGALKRRATAGLALKAVPKARREVFNAMLHETASVTGLIAGVNAANVIPNEACAVVDGRYLPGTTQENFLDMVRGVVGPGIELEPFDSADGREIDHAGPLWDCIVKVMGRHLPGCVVTPNMITGMTDAKDYARIGIKTYGFSPVKLEEGESFAELYHAPNERVSVKGLEAGAVWLYDVVKEFCEV